MDLEAWTVCDNNVIKYVYEGDCDGILTRYITASPWDFQLNVKMVRGELTYRDSLGQPILVFEPDEPEFHKYDMK